jgi:hypothetical protein
MKTKKFKTGDRVQVKSLEWYNKEKQSDGNINYGMVFTETMSKHCGGILTIKEIYEEYYLVIENSKSWQDWMLEDEAITEEEQQENKNSMETKEMTKKEVFAYLNNTKIMCTSDEETKKVQEKLFELGIEWKITGGKINEEMYLLHIHYNYLLLNSDIRNWMNSKDKRIEPSEILAIKIKEEEPKFDPKTLKPFDKVLVRDCDTEKWRARSFDMYEEHDYGEYGTTCNCFWKYCVPYCDETKHLHRTTLEAPEFYNIWE